ncbi:unnamed protein product, partial [Caenorhabditis auriculariae]
MMCQEGGIAQKVAKTGTARPAGRCQQTLTRSAWHIAIIINTNTTTFVSALLGTDETSSSRRA